MIEGRCFRAEYQQRNRQFVLRQNVNPFMLLRLFHPTKREIP